MPTRSADRRKPWWRHAPGDRLAAYATRRDDEEISFSIERETTVETLDDEAAARWKLDSTVVAAARARKLVNARALFVFALAFIALGSVAQGASLSILLRRLATVSIVRFAFRRAYGFACAVVDGARAIRIVDAWEDAGKRTRDVLRGAEKKAATSGALGTLSRPFKQLNVRMRKACTRGLAKFNADRRGMLLIPLVAAFVGWFTNWLAVQMIFYPVKFLGIPWLQYTEGSAYGFDILQPLGLIGWQGIVPAKAAQMSLTMVTMVTEKLVNVQEVFMLLNPTEVSSLLLNEVPLMATRIANMLDVPSWALSLAEKGVPALPSPMLGELSDVVSSYLSGFVVLLQQQVDRVVDLKELVVTAMCTDRVVLVDLFRRCGAAELDFLVNSGLFFGFLLGVIQMVVWAFYDNPWSITVGGLIVGLATNWLALKCIFEPVEPIFIGPFKIQGLFLQRQQEVSGTFSDYLTAKVLKSSEIWDNMLNGLKGEDFDAMLREYTRTFVIDEAARRGMVVADVDTHLIDEVAQRVVDALPEHIHVLHDYTDTTLNLQVLMREKMKLMTPQEFERVLHPIFEQDEMTLIISGAVLGAVAGYIQQIYSVKSEPRE